MVKKDSFNSDFVKEFSQEDIDKLIKNIPNILPVLPVRDIIIFPYMVHPVLVGREQSLKAVKAAKDFKGLIFLAAQRNSQDEIVKVDELYEEGTVARIIQILNLPNGMIKILVDGLVVAKALDYDNSAGYIDARLRVFPQADIKVDPELSGLMRTLNNYFKEFVKKSRNITDEVLSIFKEIEEPDRKLYYAASHINQSVVVRQEVLATLEIKAQYYALIKTLKKEIELLDVEREIETRIQENIADMQKKYVIHEQIKALQEQLGESVEMNPEINVLKEKIAKINFPHSVKEKLDEELHKLGSIPPI